MPYKSLQQLRDEQQVHHNRAMRLIEEAAELYKKMKTALEMSEYLKIQNQWIEKDRQAAAEIKKSVELTNQFIRELERLKNHKLN